MIPESLLVSFRLAIVPPQTPDRCWRGNICAKVKSQRVGYERYFRIPHHTNGGFILRLHNPLPYALDDGGMFSLKHLITTRTYQLTTIDRLLIGIKLAVSFLHLYGSPWVRGWGVGAIYYLTGQAREGPTAGRWTPHLVLRPRAGAVDAVSDWNQGMVRLGCMLLQVGLVGWGPGSETVVLTPEVMGGAFRRLDESMGSAYANLATWCLVQGWKRMSNLTLRLDMEMFMIHLGRLRRAADTADT